MIQQNIWNQKGDPVQQNISFGILQKGDAVLLRNAQTRKKSVKTDFTDHILPKKQTDQLFGKNRPNVRFRCPIRVPPTSMKYKYQNL